VARLELTRHLHELFPDIAGQEIAVEAATVAEALCELDRRVPGLAFYVCDERGRLRRHVNVFVDGERVLDRARLSDPLQPESCILIMQALSGG
jgi:hypothetical protein